MEGAPILDRVPLLSPVDNGRPRAEPSYEEPFLSFVPDEFTVNWSERLEELHEQCSRSHFIEVWTRRAMLAQLGPLSPTPSIVDVGCSAGHLLADVRARLPGATLIGVDLVTSGLRKAHEHVPDALLLHADACALPLQDACVDVVLSANLLEHVPDDEQALAEIRRTLHPGGRAVIVVPVDPGNYDYYDRLLGHERRYARGELARKASAAGLRVLRDVHLGAPLYPAFWAVKQRNRRRHGQLRGAALEQKVKGDVERTADSVIVRLACRLEEMLLEVGVRLPFGIRGLTVLERPKAGA
jgi:SAM-dependent methyltransferase